MVFLAVFYFFPKSPKYFSKMDMSKFKKSKKLLAKKNVETYQNISYGLILKNTFRNNIYFGLVLYEIKKKVCCVYV